MATPKVGIVVPAYNAGRFVKQCLQSALTQEYDNLHIYVVDDASSDDTAQIISDLARTQPTRISFERNESNKGKSTTRQRATEMALADGCDYIAPLDADDLRKPGTFLAEQVAFLNGRPDAAVCYGKTDIVNAKGELHANPRWERWVARLKGQPEGQVWPHLIARGKIGTMDTLLIRSEAARRCRYDPCFEYFQDVDYLAQIATLRNNSNFIAFDKVVASYRFHAGQSLNVGSEHLSRVMYDAMQRVALRIFHRLALQGRPVSPRRRRCLWRQLIVRSSLNAIRRKNWDVVFQLGVHLVAPLTSLEKDYRKALLGKNLREILGVWATNGDTA